MFKHGNDELLTYIPHMSFVYIQEVKAKPGDLRPKMLENMALIASKQKQNVEKAVNNLMEVSANEVRALSQGECWWGVLFCECYWCHCLKYFDLNVFQLMKRGAKKKIYLKDTQMYKMCTYRSLKWNPIISKEMKLL